jgi:DNA repair exonuclease SbcCD ATPase subunit
MAKESAATAASSDRKADVNLPGNPEGNGLNFMGVQARENGVAGDAVGVDKIRDLLFGNQMQDYDRRFSKLEERVLQRFKDVESEAKRNLEMYESNAKKQIDSLAGQLRTEKDSRADADKEIDRNLREQNQALEKQVRALSDQLSALERDVSDRINRNDHSLREEIKQKNEGVQMLIEKMFADLSNVKTDRNLLAGLFVEVAKALNQDPVGSKGNSDRSWKVS